MIRETGAILQPSNGHIYRLPLPTRYQYGIDLCSTPLYFLTQAPITLRACPWKIPKIPWCWSIIGLPGPLPYADAAAFTGAEDERVVRYRALLQAAMH